MIFINWYHYIVPKVFGAFSFIINPIFIFLVLKKSRSQMGNYRYLLISFAIFDMIYSIAELLTPIGVIHTGVGFVTFLADGPFSEDLEIGQRAVSSRCCFISLSYAILIIHFAYRYMALFKPDLARLFFQPSGILVILFFFFIHGASWTLFCDVCLSADEEIREMVRPAFAEAYNADSSRVAMLTAQYKNASSYVVWKSWIGIGSITIMSIYCTTVYLVLGYKILTKISSSCTLSKTSLLMHRQLFRALVVQTCIPIFASFVPTVIAWYSPIFNIDLTWWNNYICIIALAAFPFIDPLAVILLVPSYKNAILSFRPPFGKTRVRAVASITSSR